MAPKKKKKAKEPKTDTPEEPSAQVTRATRVAERMRGPSDHASCPRSLRRRRRARRIGLIPRRRRQRRRRARRARRRKMRRWVCAGSDEAGGEAGNEGMRTGGGVAAVRARVGSGRKGREGQRRSHPSYSPSTIVRTSCSALPLHCVHVALRHKGASTLTSTPTLPSNPSPSLILSNPSPANRHVRMCTTSGGG